MAIKDKLYTDTVIKPRADRDTVAEQVEAYIKAGGTIKVIPTGAVTLGTVSEDAVRRKLEWEKSFGGDEA